MRLNVGADQPHAPWARRLTAYEVAGARDGSVTWVTVPGVATAGGGAGVQRMNVLSSTVSRNVPATGVVRSSYAITGPPSLSDTCRNEKPALDGPWICSGASMAGCWGTVAWVQSTFAHGTSTTWRRPVPPTPSLVRRRPAPLPGPSPMVASSGERMPVAPAGYGDWTGALTDIAATGVADNVKGARYTTDGWPTFPSNPYAL